MTATNDEPDPLITEDRWQHIEDRLAAIERRIREHSSDAIATVDACLARLDALRHDLAHGSRLPQAFPTPADPPAIPPQPARARTESPPTTAGHRHAPTVPGLTATRLGGRQAAVRVPA
ncbi:hypothetical protein ACFVX9_15065 [Kitasatospora sp. NPDC058243]|uniref:hypothetical protein n=1 Tax=unclassified Kitasatospora TaxID=2633591 RepID=UPI00352E9302|nr:hypothetical protein OG556_25430 [Kitasatospora sp. NBC_01300]